MNEVGKTEQFILYFDAFVPTPGRCHVIVDRNQRAPRVLVGELDDNPSTSATNAIETVAIAISHHVLSDRRDFDLFEYVPRDLPGGKPAYYRITWEGGRPFRWPVWHPVNPATDQWLSQIQKFVREDNYTTEFVKAPELDATTSRS